MLLYLQEKHFARRNSKIPGNGKRDRDPPPGLKVKNLVIFGRKKKEIRELLLEKIAQGKKEETYCPATKREKLILQDPYSKDTWNNNYYSLYPRRERQKQYYGVPRWGLASEEETVWGDLTLEQQHQLINLLKGELIR